MIKNNYNTKNKEPEIIFPPGHFYSPIPSLKTIKKYKRLKKGKNILRAIDLNTSDQVFFIKKFSKFIKDIPFTAKNTNNCRYYFDNPNFPPRDALTLYSFIRYLKPKHIIEIGSGYSSCVILDINEMFFNYRIKCTFVEPYPELFKSLIEKSDLRGNTIISNKIQDLDLNMFKKLKANDIIFIDSTHVSKLDSDVNHIVFNILPTMNEGVFVHFHDIFFPFDYPEEWVKQGIFWNEAYILRAFLEYNNSFKIQFFNSYLYKYYRGLLMKYLPICSENPGGSIWLRKV